jgi:hypothetical protein
MHLPARRLSCATTLHMRCSEDQASRSLPLTRAPCKWTHIGFSLLANKETMVRTQCLPLFIINAISEEWLLPVAFSSSKTTPQSAMVEGKKQYAHPFLIKEAAGSVKIVLNFLLTHCMQFASACFGNQLVGHLVAIWCLVTPLDRLRPNVYPSKFCWKILFGMMRQTTCLLWKWNEICAEEGSFGFPFCLHLGFLTDSLLNSIALPPLNCA